MTPHGGADQMNEAKVGELVGRRGKHEENDEQWKVIIQ